MILQYKKEKGAECMDFKEYQKQAMRTKDADNDCLTMQLIEGALGILGESAEVAEHIKKVVFQGHDLSIEKIKEELGDSLWYITYIADLLKIKLEDVAIKNIVKLEMRYPEGFKSEYSINRKE